MPLKLEQFDALFRGRNVSLAALESSPALTPAQKAAVRAVDTTPNARIDDAEIRDLFLALGGTPGGELDLSGQAGQVLSTLLAVPDQARALLAGTLASNGSLGQADGPALPLAGGFAQYVQGGSYENGRAMLVTGESAGAVHLVKNSFFKLYTSAVAEYAHQPLHELLGRPSGAEYGFDGGARQDFENGYLLWKPDPVGPSYVLTKPPQRPPPPPPPDTSGPSPAVRMALENYYQANKAGLGQKAGDPVRIGSGFGQWVEGGNYPNGRALVMEAVGPSPAQPVMAGFLTQYTAQSGGVMNAERLGRPRTGEYGWNGGTRQDFEKGYLTWTPSQGVRMELSSTQNPPPPPPPGGSAGLGSVQPGQVLADGARVVSIDQLESTAGVQVTRGTVTRMVEFDIVPQAGKNGIPRIDGTGPRRVDLPTVTLTNRDGTALTFLADGQYGGRLLQATVKDAGGQLKTVLYENNTPKRTNWGPELPGGGTQGWVGIGGVEVGFGPNEHGTYNSTRWNTLAKVYPDGSLGFISRTRTDPGDTFTEAMGVAVETKLSPDGASYQMSHEVQNLDTKAISPHYWVNFMVPAGSRDRAEDVEVRIPSPDNRALVHSAGGRDKVSPFDVIDLSNFEGRDLRHMNRNVREWLGIFGVRPVTSYAMRNHDRGVGVRIDAQAGRIHPKFFVAPGFDPGMWTNDGTRYNEFWFSPFNQSFWTADELRARNVGLGEVTDQNLFAPQETKRVSYQVTLEG